MPIIKKVRSQNQLFQALGQRPMRGQQLPEFDKGPHHIDADFGRPGAIKDLSLIHIFKAARVTVINPWET